MTAAQTAWGLADRCTQPRAAETRPGQLPARGCFTKVLRRKPPHPGRVRARLCELRARNARMHPCRSAHGRAPASSGETSSRSSSGQSGGFLNRRQEVRVLPGAPFSNGGPIWRARRLDPAFRRKGTRNSGTRAGAEVRNSSSRALTRLTEEGVEDTGRLSGTPRRRGRQPMPQPPQCARGPTHGRGLRGRKRKSGTRRVRPPRLRTLHTLRKWISVRVDRCAQYKIKRIP